MEAYLDFSQTPLEIKYTILVKMYKHGPQMELRVVYPGYNPQHFRNQNNYLNAQCDEFPVVAEQSIHTI